MHSVTSNAVATALNYASYGTEINTGLKWIDGKTIYRKSYRLVIADATQEFNHLISNLGTITKIDGVIEISNGSFLPLNFIAQNGTYFFSTFLNSTKIEIRTVSAYVGTIFYLTVEYTKTS